MRNALWIALAAILALFLAAAGWFWARPAWRRHAERRDVALAAKFLAAGDYSNASLSARRALKANPNSLEASLLMARMADSLRSPQALDWWRRVAEIGPTAENKLSLAGAAIRYQTPPHPLAAQVLDELGRTEQGSPAFHLISADLAMRLGRLEQAAEHFEAAKRLQPENPVHRLNLAVIRLHSTNDSVAGVARGELVEFSKGTNTALIALRWLAADAVKHGELARAKRFSKDLLRVPGANLDDRLQQLGILKKTDTVEFADGLAAMEAECRTNAVGAYALGSWMLRMGMAGESLAWLTNCPPAVLQQQPAPLALAEVYTAVKAWTELDAYLSQQKWGELEYLRQAMLCRTAVEDKRNLSADSAWRSAVNAAGDSLGRLTTLLGMTQQWAGDNRKADLLWRIVQRFPRERWALKELDLHYLKTGNTRGLHKLYSNLAAQQPRNYAAQNNLAATSLLLHANLPQAHAVAKQTYSVHPEIPEIAATYAYSLHLQGRTFEGLQVLKRVESAARTNSSVALYYGVLLQGVEKTNEAAPYLALAATGNLLPEEKALVAR